MKGRKIGEEENKRRKKTKNSLRKKTILANWDGTYAVCSLHIS